MSANAGVQSQGSTVGFCLFSMPQKVQEGWGLGAFPCCFKEKKSSYSDKAHQGRDLLPWNKPELAVLTSSLADVTHSSTPTVHTGKCRDTLDE